MEKYTDGHEGHTDPKWGILIKAREGSQVKISPGDILWLEAHGNYTDIHVATIQQHYTVTCQISKLIKKLAYPPLVKVHRSYAVNLQKVHGVKGNRVSISNKEI